jgi:Fe-S cluster biogenesis protein NfuA
MSQPTEVIAEVLGLLEPMVASDGGSLRMAEFAPERGALVVDYDKGRNDACAACVIDSDSLKAFIDEGLQSRGLHLDDITVTETV